MALHRFRLAAAAWIAFNIVGTVVTWTAHLSKPGTATTHAILQGTEFTGPLVLIALWIAAVALTYRTGRAAVVGVWLTTLFALVYAVGDVTELTKSNIGVSAGKWHAILALDALGLAVALCAVVFGIAAIAQTRQVAAAATH